MDAHQLVALEEVYNVLISQKYF